MPDSASLPPPDPQTPSFTTEELAATEWINQNWITGLKIAGADSRYTAFWAYVAGAKLASAKLEQMEAANKALLVLVHGDWRDKPDQWTKEIEAAHPMETNQFKQYEMALEMVGNRNGKYELVDLVNWLLSRAALASSLNTEKKT